MVLREWSCRMGGDPFAVLKPLKTLQGNLEFLRRMGGDPFAVLKLEKPILVLEDAGCRMGGDPFAVLKRISLMVLSIPLKAAWGETLLRY